MKREACIAVFDLDGTLTRRDTYLPYLFGFLMRQPWRIYRLVYLPWIVGMYYLGMLDNARLKEYFLRVFVGGTQRATLRLWTAAFVSKLIASGLRHEGLAVLERHRQDGNLLVLLSASLDIYVKELATYLGFDQVICTEAHWHGDRLSGRLLSPNCHGAEKARQLKYLRKKYPEARLVVYANHHSDLPLLQLADLGILINGTNKAKSLATEARIECREW